MTNAQWIEERLAKAENRTKDLEKWVDTGVKPRRIAAGQNHSETKKKT